MQLKRRLLIPFSALNSLLPEQALVIVVFIG